MDDEGEIAVSVLAMVSMRSQCAADTASVGLIMIQIQGLEGYTRDIHWLTGSGHHNVSTRPNVIWPVVF